MPRTVSWQSLAPNVAGSRSPPPSSSRPSNRLSTSASRSAADSSGEQHGALATRPTQRLEVGAAGGDGSRADALGLLAPAAGDGHERDHRPSTLPVTQPPLAERGSHRAGPASSLPPLMGSLIKKRRKRMRKKKHKKMLRRTRFQRRNK